MESHERESLELAIEGVEVGDLADGYQPVRLETSRGVVECRHYAVPGARKAAIWVGGVGGGWDSPARELYERLSNELVVEDIASLRVRYRHPTDLEEATLDVLAGLTYLESEGVEAFSLTGHSFGGAVVIQAAAAFSTVRTVVTLSTQSFGTGAVARLAPGCSILLVHGAADTVLPATSSEYVYGLAPEPRQIVIYPGAGHGLDEAAEPVYRLVRDWVVDRLALAGSESEAR